MVDRMSKRHIAAIGFELATDDVVELDFTQNQSLLDFDIVLFRPSISSIIDWSDTYNGKPCLNDDRSFHLKECCEHWRREIRGLVDAGKTVIVFLCDLQEAYIATGERTYSGTGRNRHTTRHVALFNNYKSLPTNIKAVPSTGKAIKLAARGAEAISGYWAEFKDSSTYKVILEAGTSNNAAKLLTRIGDKPVGMILRGTPSSGALVLLPDVEFCPPTFVKPKGDEEVWTPAAEQFAQRFLASTVDMDRALRAEGEITPMPSWANAPEYGLSVETKLRSELLLAEREVEQATKRKEMKEDELRSIGGFRGLLFEKGKPLERSIIDGLGILGFSAAPFVNAESEFDVVFSCSEGRLIGEAEGKDNKAISIDKLRQLAMNIHEDLDQAAVERPAKAVLFGNPFRLDAVERRGEPFTDKCMAAATSSSTALVFTPDLFRPIQYLLSNPDDDYAKSCRMAIICAVGRVQFPLPPSVMETGKAEGLVVDKLE
jgi:hypothetical protein